MMVRESGARSTARLIQAANVNVDDIARLAERGTTTRPLLRAKRPSVVIDKAPPILPATQTLSVSSMASLPSLPWPELSFATVEPAGSSNFHQATRLGSSA